MGQANYKETELTHVYLGQPAAIKVDAYPGVEFKGRVDSIMAGTGAAFSLLPPENATGNWIKVVQRVPVKITLTRPTRQPPPAPGDVHRGYHRYRDAPGKGCRGRKAIVS
jgi:membrane fusion protein (multidrug efflux system)